MRRLIFNISFAVSFFIGVIATPSEFKKLCKIDGTIKTEKLGLSKSREWTVAGRDVYQKPLGVRENQMSKFRWQRSGDGKIYLEREDVGKDLYAPPISSETCQSTVREDFELVECSGLVKLVYEKNQLLFVAFEEYGAPKIDILEKVKFKDSTHFLIKTWEKGTEEYFDLHKVSNTWTARVCSKKTEPID